MKLVKMADEKIGNLRAVTQGSLRDRHRRQLLNGALKDGHDWSLLVKHWAHLRAPVKKLQKIPLACPEHSLVLQSLTSVPRRASAANSIIAIEITDTEIFEEQDPKGRLTMERQLCHF
jgi:hypothetical protein